VKRALLVMVAAALATAGCNQGPSSGSAATPSNSTVTVTYRLTGTASYADLTYTDSLGKQRQEFDIAVPLRNMGGTEGLDITAKHGQEVSFTAEIAYYSGTLDCTIEADGVKIDTAHASGARYTKVNCSATLP
jgi:hypothetical protein